MAGRIVETINTMEAEGPTVHASLLEQGVQKLGLESAQRQKYTIGIVCVLVMAVLVIAAILCAPFAFPLVPAAAPQFTQTKKAPNV